MRPGLGILAGLLFLQSSSWATNVPPTQATPPSAPESPRALRVDLADRAAATQNVLAAHEQKLKPFAYKNVVVSCRSGPGNGNEGAMWMTAKDLAGRFGSSVTVVAGPRELDVLSRLSGEELKDSSVLKVGTGEIRFKLPPKAPAADLVLHLGYWGGPVGAKNGRLQDEYRSTNEGQRIPMDGHTVFEAVPLFFSTTEVSFYASRHGVAAGAVHLGTKERPIKGAGLEENRAGVYTDPVAVALRDRSEPAVRRYVLQSLGEIPNEDTRRALTDIVEGRRLAGATRGLAYGIGSTSIQYQVNDYVKGLAEDAKQRGVSYVVVTPSRVAEEIKGQVHYFRATDAIPEHAEPGQVYVVEVETLPHQAFVSLIADSQIPPVVSGDSALSAALGLGKPFAMTAVMGHNEMNISALRRRLESLADPAQKTLVDEMFPDNDAKRDTYMTAALAKVLSLNTPEFRRIFREATDKVGSLTDYLVQAADDMRRSGSKATK